MIKQLTCIDCPIGCTLDIDIENCKVVSVSGNKCPKGHDYAVSEIENPVRILTSTVVARNMDLKMIPVRTDKPIPVAKIMVAAQEIRKIKIEKGIKVGDILVENFLGLGVNLIATRDASLVD